jgi:hypothetical protein
MAIVEGGPKDTVQKLKLNEEQREKLRDYLKKELNTCEIERGRLLDKCKAWVQQANSRRQRKDVKARDSNIDMPLTRQRMMQNSARLLNPIFQQDILFVARPRNPQMEDIARSVENLVDFISDGIDYRTVCDEWIEQFQTFPFGVLKTPFIAETERIKKWQEITGSPEEGTGPIDEYNQRKLDGQKVVVRRLEDGTERYYLEVDEEVPVRVGAFPEVVPFEDFIVPMSAVDVRTADWVIHRVWMTEPAIQSRIRSGVYEKRDGDSDVLEALGEPSAERERLLRLGEKRDKQLDLDDSTKQYEICEAYLKWAVNEKEEPFEIIVTFEKSSMVILRAVHNFYHSYKRPFVVHEYKKTQGSIFGVPLTFILEPLHVAYSASFNQRLDAASRANDKTYGVPSGSASTMKQVDRDYMLPGLIEIDAKKDEVIEFKHSEPGFSQLPELEAKLESEADKLSSLSDYSFGQEQIDRPTATGQVQIIEESKQPQYMMLERFRASLAEVCKHVLSRYRQFFPEGLQYYAMQESPEGMQMIQQFFQWPAEAIEKDVIIETKVSSASMSKSLRKQEIVALLDKLIPYYHELMALAQVATDPMNPMSLIAVKLMNGLYTVMNDMLTEFEVGKKDRLNPELMQEMQVVQQIQQAMQQMQQQINQLSNQNQQLQATSQQQAAIIQQAGLDGQPVPQPPVQGPMPMGPPQGGPGGQPVA